jgi:plasmid stabilization system protein ParE
VPLVLHITRRAAAEIARHAEWWSKNRLAATGAIRKDLRAAFRVLKEHPGMGGVVEEASQPDIRRFFVDRIQYWVYYRVRGERLEILSVWHSARGQGPTV